MKELGIQKMAARTVRTNPQRRKEAWRGRGMVGTRGLLEKRQAI